MAAAMIQLSNVFKFYKTQHHTKIIHGFRWLLLWVARRQRRWQINHLATSRWHRTSKRRQSAAICPRLLAAWICRRLPSVDERPRERSFRSANLRSERQGGFGFCRGFLGIGRLPRCTDQNLFFRYDGALGVWVIHGGAI